MLLFLKENTPKKVIRDTCPSITYYFAKYHRLLIWLLILIVAGGVGMIIAQSYGK